MAARMVRKLRWNKQIYCPYCACIDDIKPHSNFKNGIKRYLCTNCMKTFTDITDTIYEKTKVPLWKWIYGMIILLESTGSLSAAELSRNIEVSYPTALKMMRKIRSGLWKDRFEGTLKGVCESDEAWISKKKNQQILLGTVERNGKLKLFPILDRSDVSLYFPHRKYVEAGSIVCTDSFSTYQNLNHRYIHHTVNHSIKQFAWRDVHTNTIEGVWSMLKGVLRTIHHGVWKRHLQGYLDLFAFMYSHRSLSISEKFNLLIFKSCQPRYCLY
jgi:transposase-like protein